MTPPHVQYLDSWTCPDCRTVLSRERMTGRVWMAFVEDHEEACRAMAPDRLERGQQEDVLFVLARLSRVAETVRLAREVVAKQGVGSHTLESVVVRALSGLDEIERRILETRTREGS